MKLYEEGKYNLALEVFRKLLYAYPINPFTDDAQYYIASIYYLKREYDLAMMEIDFFLRNFAYSELYVKGLILGAKIYYRKFNNIHLDISELRKGEEYARKAIKLAKTEDERKQAREILESIRLRFARKHLLAAETYRKLKRYHSEYIYLKTYMELYGDLGDTAYVKSRLKQLESILDEDSNTGR